MRRLRMALPVVMLAAVSACAGSAARAAAPAKVTVVAAEDFWGSIARQLGGDRAEVTSLIADPNTDPHDYEAKPSDGAAVARARVAIVNGIGYDGWMGKLVAANPSSSRTVVTVGTVVGVKEGGNPHQWYSPRSVDLVIDAITEALKRADPADAGYFDAQRQAYRADGLKRYNDLRAQIRAQFGGVAVGASESIFAPLAEDLGLKIITPGSFLGAVSEGNEPTARDKATVDSQITGKQIKAFLYNSQNSTPDVRALVAKAKAAGIPVTTVTETLVPAGATFQDWQVDQLQRLNAALALATGTNRALDGAAPVPTPAATASPAGGAAESFGSSPTAGAPTASTPTAGLARTGGRARPFVFLAGAAMVAGGLGVAGGAARRRHRRPAEGA